MRIVWPGDETGTVVASERSLSRLVVDELLSRALDRMAKRATRRTGRIPSVCVSSNDLIARRIISTGIFESSQLETLDHLVRNRFADLGRDLDRMDLFVDVGANIGIYATRYSDFFEETIAVEANPVTFKLLEANLMLQDTSRVTPVCIGASDTSGEGVITIREEGNLGGASIARPCARAADGVLNVPVRLEPLDSLVEARAPGRRVDLIKVDVEGYEAHVLRGARKTIRRDRPVILYERTGASDGQEVDAILKECGYEDFCLFERVLGLDRLPPRTALQLRKLSPDSIVNSALVCAY
ncbi:hypothetical protein CSC94_19150 [Zhengella mangrovi]|uniref:Methyltransferase FkbM domain-containing protein n=1 Tax=Zhengella mangrovi TaxID=1982044 RepID=A0A2G1QIY4_9HYPH|nr:FkbM family methyltransferase [Zhengella mangrovi]PHP65472.1 hypothetical protein CSC94_19150 [Zhengella mangrovi]